MFKIRANDKYGVKATIIITAQSYIAAVNWCADNGYGHVPSTAIEELYSI